MDNVVCVLLNVDNYYHRVGTHDDWGERERETSRSCLGIPTAIVVARARTSAVVGRFAQKFAPPSPQNDTRSTRLFVSVGRDCARS